MEAKRGRPPAVAQSRDPPALVVFVGQQVPDRSVVEALLTAGAVVLLASRAELVRHWLSADLGEPVLMQLEQPEELVLLVNDLRIDLQKHEASWRGRVLPLSERELALIATLARVPGRAVSFPDLFERAWPGEYFGDPALVKVAVRRLRRKLKEAGARIRIKAVRAFGFRPITS